MTQPPAIEFSAIAKCATRWTWRGPEPVSRLAPFSLRVAPGEVVGLIGPNGAGKSTVIGIAAGLIRSSSGQCRVQGLPVERSSSRRAVGYVGGGPVGFDGGSALASLVLRGRLGGLEVREAVRRADELIVTWSLGTTARRPLATLSKGQRQRWALAHALIHRPAVLLLDEPSDGLDPEAHELTRAAIEHGRAHGAATLIASHQFSLLARVCDRVFALRAGRSVGEWASENFRRECRASALAGGGDSRLDALFGLAAGGSPNAVDGRGEDHP